jgi:hypothetical protein
MMLRKRNLMEETIVKFTDSTAFAPPAGKSKQFAEGIIRIRRIPDSWSDADYRYWYLPETDKHGKIIRPARISDHEKEGMQLEEYRNQITNLGRAQVLSYIGSPSGSSTQWAQQFGIGTGAITATSPTDTSLSNEIWRKPPTAFSVNGTLVDINIPMSTSDASGSVFTNCGIFGNGATSTLSSGSLLTHALFSFSKGSVALSVDYLINLL